MRSSKWLSTVNNGKMNQTCASVCRDRWVQNECMGEISETETAV